MQVVHARLSMPSLCTLEYSFMKLAGISNDQCLVIHGLQNIATLALAYEKLIFALTFAIAQLSLHSSI